MAEELWKASAVEIAAGIRDRRSCARSLRIIIAPSLLLPARGLGTPVAGCHAAPRLLQPKVYSGEPGKPSTCFEP
jgi:hypothetical protein